MSKLKATMDALKSSILKGINPVAKPTLKSTACEELLAPESVKTLTSEQIQFIHQVKQASDKQTQDWLNSAQSWM